MSLPQDEVNRLKQTKTIGIIGLGDMGLLYAKRFSEAGWKVVGCDREEIYEDIKLKYFNEKFEILKMDILYQEYQIILFIVLKLKILIK